MGRQFGCIVSILLAIDHCAFAFGYVLGKRHHLSFNCFELRGDLHQGGIGMRESVFFLLKLCGCVFKTFSRHFNALIGLVFLGSELKLLLLKCVLLLLYALAGDFSVLLELFKFRD